jgi:hypothetical protein
VKEALQKQLEGAQAELEAAAGQLAESRKKGEALAAQLATAEEAKGVAEKVGDGLQTHLRAHICKLQGMQPCRHNCLPAIAQLSCAMAVVKRARLCLHSWQQQRRYRGWQRKWVPSSDTFLCDR